MPETKEKRSKPVVPVREPHKRTKTGIFDNLRQLPHPVEEFLADVPVAPRIQDPPAQDLKPVESIRAMDSESLTNIEGLANTESPVNFTSLSNITGPADSERPVEIERPLEFTSPVKNRAKALQITGPVESTSPVENGGATSGQSPADLAELSVSKIPDFSLLSSLPDVYGYAPSFHQVIDYLLRQLTTAEQAIYVQLYRLTWGYERSTVIVGFPKLSERANVGESTARAAAKALESKGLIRRVGLVFGLNHEQGIEWEVYPPSALVKYLRSKEERRLRGSKYKGPANSEGPSDSEPMKDNVLFSKEHTQTQAGASVNSRFSLEECRRYADHLKATGQGITNPGGYATKIFRSGEADAFIESFLNPPTELDINQCTDCRGTGFIYIDQSNHDRGVRPCKHDSLKSSRE
jgi:hypothetical protein